MSDIINQMTIVRREVKLPEGVSSFVRMNWKKPRLPRKKKKAMIKRIGFWTATKGWLCPHVYGSITKL